MPAISIDLARRRWLRAASATACVSAIPGAVIAHAGAPHAEVWADPDYACCHQWIKHLQNYSFTVRLHEAKEPAEIRRRFGMPEKYAGCHTARVDRYVIEGHVPALDIERLLRERPRAIGLAVPGMPNGSPGMEQGGPKDPYQVLLIGEDAGATVFKSYL